MQPGTVQPSEDRWTCRECGKRWVVPILARDCAATDSAQNVAKGLDSGS